MQYKVYKTKIDTNIDKINDLKKPLNNKAFSPKDSKYFFIYFEGNNFRIKNTSAVTTNDSRIKNTPAVITSDKRTRKLSVQPITKKGQSDR